MGKREVGGATTFPSTLSLSLSPSVCNLFMNAFCHMAQWKYKWAAKALFIDSTGNLEIMVVYILDQFQLCGN